MTFAASMRRVRSAPAADVERPAWRPREALGDLLRIRVAVADMPFAAVIIATVQERAPSLMDHDAAAQAVVHDEVRQIHPTPAWSRTSPQEWLWASPACLQQMIRMCEWSDLTPWPRSSGQITSRATHFGPLP